MAKNSILYRNVNTPSLLKYAEVGGNIHLASSTQHRLLDVIFDAQELALGAVFIILVFVNYYWEVPGYGTVVAMMVGK